MSFSWIVIRQEDMDQSQHMKDKLDLFLSLIKKDQVHIIVPVRKGLRKMVPMHTFHDYAEIFLQTEGRTRFQFPTESLELNSGDILIVPPELPHAEEVGSDKSHFESIVITPAEQFLQCHISRDSVKGIPIISYHEIIHSKDIGSIRQFSDLLIERGSPGDQYSSTISSGLCLALIASVRTLLSSNVQPLAENRKIVMVKNAVLSQYHRNTLSVSQLADQLNCTADYLSWLFHRETGMTLNRFINLYRLKKAADLLKNTDYTISEIAWICGYKNPAYFSRVFSKEYSLPPRDFR